MAGVPEASRSGFYGWLAKGGPEDPRAELGEAAWRVRLESDRIFGARSVRAFPPGGPSGATLYRARKRMKELGARGTAPDSKKRAAVPGEGAPARPGLVERGFTGPAPACKPAGDITRPKAEEGRLYPAAVVDPRARTVAGRAVSERMAAGIAVEALERAWRRGYVAGSAVLRPDRGSQRTPRLPACRADGREARLSVGRAGSRHGNAVAESFLATLGNSMHSLREWRAREGARDAAIRFIERRCNRHRPRPTIGSRVPGEAMDALFEGAKPAEAAVGQRAREGRTAAW